MSDWCYRCVTINQIDSTYALCEHTSQIHWKNTLPQSANPWKGQIVWRGPEQSDQEVEGIRLHAQLSRICLRLDLCRSCVYGSGQAVTTVSWYVKTPCSVHRNDFSVFIYLPCYCSALRGWLAEVYTVPLGLSILQSFVSTFRQPWVSVLIIMRSKQAETRVYPCLQQQRHQELV